MYISAEEAKQYTGTVGQQAFIELGFDSLCYVKMIKDANTGQTAAVLYSGLGIPVTAAATRDAAEGVAIQNGMEMLSLH